MFCTNCGSKIAHAGDQFCAACGARAPQDSPAPPVAPSVTAAPPIYHPAAPPSPPSRPAAVAHAAVGNCTWCGSPLQPGQLSCTACGGTVSEMGRSSHAGWIQLPGRKDMAKLQFGQSTCQIEGAYVPVADFNLVGPDSVYFAHHSLLWKDASATITTMPLKGAWKRMFAGLPLIMTQAQGPGHIAFSRDAAGELIAVPLHPGQTVDVREHLFLAATGNVTYDWFQSDVWFKTKNGDDTETHYPVGYFMDRFTGTQQPGLLLLHASGNVFMRTLGHGESMLVKPTAMIFKDPPVQMHLHFEHPQTNFVSWGSWSNRYLWLRVTGPGRVAIQSSFERLEGEARYIQNHSYATEVRW